MAVPKPALLLAMLSVLPSCGSREDRALAETFVIAQRQYGALPVVLSEKSAARLGPLFARNAPLPYWAATVAPRAAAAAVDGGVDEFLFLRTAAETQRSQFLRIHESTTGIESTIDPTEFEIETLYRAAHNRSTWDELELFRAMALQDMDLGPTHPSSDPDQSAVLERWVRRRPPSAEPTDLLFSERQGPGHWLFADAPDAFANRHVFLGRGGRLPDRVALALFAAPNRVSTDHPLSRLPESSDSLELSVPLELKQGTVRYRVWLELAAKDGTQKRVESSGVIDDPTRQRIDLVAPPFAARRFRAGLELVLSEGTPEAVIHVQPIQLVAAGSRL